ncbi:hypothetical protein HMPREF0022_02452 [Acinetobacter baumannii 6014059]|uniref:Uncharacterized protein n=1 Tax=Acinetobacter baumannii 6014059 TaxID=525242 RepID=A0A828SNT0_ACIBA|nr:hypothetical protein HMPREF0022_02452 [Acinetobacter baumannii 6014059]
MMIYGYVQNVRHEIMRHAHHARNIAYWSLMYQDKERVKNVEISLRNPVKHVIV